MVPRHREGCESERRFHREHIRSRVAVTSLASPIIDGPDTFVIVNVLVFQPWDRDNNKLLVYWFLAVTILVAALVVRTWRRHRSATVRFLLAAAVATLIAGPILENVAQWEGQGRYLVLSAEQIALDGEIRDKTDAHALFGGQGPAPVQGWNRDATAAGDHRLRRPLE